MNAFVFWVNNSYTTWFNQTKIICILYLSEVQFKAISIIKQKYRLFGMIGDFYFFFFLILSYKRPNLKILTFYAPKPIATLLSLIFFCKKYFTRVLWRVVLGLGTKVPLPHINVSVIKRPGNGSAMQIKWLVSTW